MANWFWKQTHWDNYTLIGPDGSVRHFRDYPKLCVWCGFNGVKAIQS